MTKEDLQRKADNENLDEISKLQTALETYRLQDEMYFRQLVIFRLNHITQELLELRKLADEDYSDEEDKRK